MEPGDDSISCGDIGVLLDRQRSHIYLVINAGNPSMPDIADHQAISPPPLQVAGNGAMPQTGFFPRAD